MLRRILMMFAVAALATGSWAVTPTFDGSDTGDGYSTAVNTAPEIDTNDGSGFGDSAFSARVVATDDDSRLYVFVEGSLHSSNRLFVCIDSDDDAGTGANGTFPGTFGEAAALSYFDSLPAGGYDLVVVIQANSNPPTDLGTVVLAYNSAGDAAVTESFTAIGSLSGTAGHTIRGIANNLQVTYNDGRGANQGMEIGIPKAWLLEQAFTGDYQLVILNGNGGNDFWSNSTIPDNNLSTNIGFAGQSDDNPGALAGLTAPFFAWTTQPPGVAVSLNSTAPNPTNTSPIPVTVDFTAAVTGFDPIGEPGDVLLTNATLGNFQTLTPGLQYSFDLTPQAQGFVGAQIPQGAAQAQVGGDDNTTSSQIGRTYDTVSPTAQIISGAPDPTGSDPFQATIWFSEALANLTTLADLVPTNATLDNLTTVVARQIYSFDVNPTANGAVTVSYTGTGSDAAGNAVTPPSALSRTYDSGVTDTDSLFQGERIYATGGGPVLEGFRPGTVSALQLRDDGTRGDITPGDGIFSVDFTPLVTRPRIEWKAASEGFDPVSIPFDNSMFRPEAGVTTKFVVDTNERDDNFLPDPDGTVNKGFLYTVPSNVRPGSTVTVVGTFQDELGGPAEFDNQTTLTVMSDPDMNDIYTLEVTGLPPGNYTYIVTVDRTFDFRVSQAGWSTGGFDLSFAVFDTSDTLTFEFDSIRGRTRVVSDNPVADPDAWFAVSDAWSNDVSTGTLLYDDGTNGDVTPGDGILSREFRVNDIGSTWTLQVRQLGGNFRPGNGGYPFSTTQVPQFVLVQLDTNAPGDGYTPVSDYVWTDPVSRFQPVYVQAVGTFQTDLGGTGNFDPDDINFELFDDGSSGDVTAGDGVYAATFAAVGITDAEYKAIGAKVRPPSPGTNFFDYQYGGPFEGTTFQGNNTAMEITVPAGTPIVLQADTVTGRVGVGAAGPTRPATIDALPQSTVNSAQRWSLYN